MERLLVIDDDAELCQLVTRFLEREGFEIGWAPNGAAGIERALAEHYSLILLDVMMPGTDGFDVLRRIRQQSRTPVLMLTARGDTHDRIRGLEMGADDYLPKPFDPDELVARIRAILRRAHSTEPLEAQSVIEAGGLKIDLARRKVERDGDQIKLTPAEYNLQQVLAQPGGMVT